MWLYSEKLGKISVIVHGARKSRNKFFPLTLPFCYGEYVLFRGKSLYTLNEGEIIESFQTFLDSLEGLTYASYFNELVDISSVDEESSRELFKELVICYYLIKSNAVDMDILTRAFELRVLKDTGYGLNLEECCNCGNKIKTCNFISYQYYGGICNNCIRNYGLHVSFAAFNILKYLIKTPLEHIYKLSVSKEVTYELESILSNFIFQSYSKRPNSLEMIKFLRSDKNE